MCPGAGTSAGPYTILLSADRTQNAEIPMLDVFRSITGGKSRQAQQQTDELEMLIATAREERSAISTMLTALTARGAKLPPVNKILEDVAGRATMIAERLDEIALQLTALDDRTRGLEELRGQ